MSFPEIMSAWVSVTVAGVLTTARAPPAAAGGVIARPMKSQRRTAEIEPVVGRRHGALNVCPFAAAFERAMSAGIRYRQGTRFLGASSKRPSLFGSIASSQTLATGLSMTTATSVPVPATYFPKTRNVCRFSFCIVE